MIKLNSPIILAFSTICIVIFLLIDMFQIGIRYLFITESNFDLYNWEHYPPLILHVFGHSTTDHLFGNLSIGLLIGPLLEEKYGWRRILIAILVTALVTGICNSWIFHDQVWGASGVILMLIALSSFTNIKNREIPITFLLVISVYIGREILQADNMKNISFESHIIGGIIGSIFGFIFNYYGTKELESLESYDHGITPSS